jgi:hypothetical protein
MVFFNLCTARFVLQEPWIKLEHLFDITSTSVEWSFIWRQLDPAMAALVFGALVSFIDTQFLSHRNKFPGCIKTNSLANCLVGSTIQLFPFMILQHAALQQFPSDEESDSLTNSDRKKVCFS